MDKQAETIREMQFQSAPPREGATAVAILANGRGRVSIRAPP